MRKGVKINRPRKSKISVNTMVKLYHGGLSVKKIAELAELYRATVVTYLARRGIKLRSKSESNILRRGKYGKGYRIKKGYRVLRLPFHPDADADGYVKEHRIIIEWHLGRFLRKDEDVHHINEDKLDNRIENLELVSRSKHMSIHMKKLREAYKKCCGR